MRNIEHTQTDYVTHSISRTIGVDLAMDHYQCQNVTTIRLLKMVGFRDASMFNWI